MALSMDSLTIAPAETPKSEAFQERVVETHPEGAPAKNKLENAEDLFKRIQEYAFAGGNNQHFFCGTCGVRVFGVGNDTPIGKMVGVNLGCLEGVSEEMLSTIPVVAIDGMHDRMETPEFFAHL